MVSSTARAQTIGERFTLNADVGVGFSQPDFTATPTRFVNVLSGAVNVRPGFNLTEHLSVHLFGGLWMAFGQAVRLDPLFGAGFTVGGTIAHRVHPFLGLDAGAAISGNGPKAFWQAGGGFEFLITPSVGLGPFARYSYETRISQEPERTGWTFGASFSFRNPWPEPPPPPPEVADTDSDGVNDPQDQCPTVPAGTTPHPTRAGCPRTDTDHDTVWDDEDQCVDQAMGEHPDPARRGCPVGDADSDGVLDDTDQCVNQAAGDHPDPARAGCPDRDTDSDGVFDAQDQCREQAAGANPDPARVGCPIPDRDGDSVLDPSDHCPDQPGAPSPDPNRNGCPGLVAVQNGQVRINRPIQFASNSAVILPASTPILNAVADALRASPQIRRVSVDGHTDDNGPDARNMTLSTARAAAVMTWLTAHGIEASRLESHGYGETRPSVAITDLRGAPLNAARAQNRRVEFNILDPRQTP